MPGQRHVVSLPPVMLSPSDGQQAGGSTMNEDKNVIDLEARAAQQRAHRQGFLLTELDGSTIK